MTIYQGNGAYCYANSASMLLSTIGEHVSPSLIEVITGFALGASFSQNGMIFFDNCASSPDQGINRAFEILGFHVNEKVCREEEQVPLEELRKDLSKSPVMLGPLDMGYLTYLPNHQFLGGCDHYVFALKMNETEVILHDPAGYPFVRLTFAQLESAWKAEKITCSQGSYRCWVSPERISNPSQDDIYDKAIQLFRSSYGDQHNFALQEQLLVGKNAIRFKAEQIRNESFVDGEIGHFIHFAFPLGARRALDFSMFFSGRHERLTELKETQSRLFGTCQTLSMLKKWEEVAVTLELLADVEEEIESTILSL
ncbi:hypothetical protein [Paenibacillus apiarius]|uniref:Butirosin biosynthesis protein H N-terminal domain-containing protein n=1 Tax=Paenibacillus apiarius TaxID=46240 RepID=A0ABT4E1M0_9BACL|nr:hypothetical protein [Paenibacillus apiarius]MCY9514971.1 hypothetical protein [Paenibacillus apiarius]MCY9522408.1 hypothetical protein [Paenibacillus apiarius]MCY9552172.1 hypothetical protein [Paenibacillus apiarius]MCY9561041.1 hypothetical protein [Paenibacillus apiarius]MCY9686318.1 hypothetical protein [Paenibacillus apiarius]